MFDVKSFEFIKVFDRLRLCASINSGWQSGANGIGRDQDWVDGAGIKNGHIKVLTFRAYCSVGEIIARWRGDAQVDIFVIFHVDCIRKASGKLIQVFICKVLNIV